MEDRWVYVEAKWNGRPYMAGIQFPIDPARWPEYDHHVAIALTYAPHWRTGLPKPKELERLQAFEEAVIEKLEGHGVLVASETTDMRRTVHLYIRGGGPLLAMFEEWAQRREKGTTVTVAHDPAWAGVVHLADFAARAAQPA